MFFLFSNALAEVETETSCIVLYRTCGYIFVHYPDMVTKLRTIIFSCLFNMPLKFQQNRTTITCEETAEMI